jgi:thioredoxin 2
MSESARITCTGCGQANRVPLARLAQNPKCGSCGGALITGKVAELDLRTHDKATGTDGVPLLIDYWAPWCGPCRMMAPEVARAAAALAPDVRLGKINTEDHPEVSRRLGIRGIPLLILWHQGREVARLPGARPAAEITAFVREALRHPV